MTIARVEIYTRQACGYCVHAKALLDRKGVPYEEHDVGRDPARRAEMQARAPQATTVPQIFIDGGCDELYGLDRAGRLDALLGR